MIGELTCQMSQTGSLLHDMGSTVCQMSCFCDSGDINNFCYIYTAWYWVMIDCNIVGHHSKIQSYSINPKP